MQSESAEGRYRQRIIRLGVVGLTKPRKLRIRLVVNCNNAITLTLAGRGPLARLLGYFRPKSMQPFPELAAKFSWASVPAGFWEAFLISRHRRAACSRLRQPVRVHLANRWLEMTTFPGNLWADSDYAMAVLDWICLLARSIEAWAPAVTPSHEMTA